jgi:hypothetical protein
VPGQSTSFTSEKRHSAGVFLTFFQFGHDDTSIGSRSKKLVFLGAASLGGAHFPC